MIEIKKLTKSFGPVQALKSISLQLPSRQNHVVIGSSGSGKTTLLRILLGLEAPTSGQVTVDGEAVNGFEQIGYMPQNGGLFPHMTALRNVSLMAQLRSWPKIKINTRAEELSQLIGLDTDFLKRFPSQMSGGQRQRVSLMRALFLDPQILILDEPLGALDPLIRYDLQTELAKIFKKLNKTVVIVTHDLSEAVFFGKTITLLHEGQMMQTGSFDDLNLRPQSKFVTQFLQAQRPLVFEDSP